MSNIWFSSDFHFGHKNIAGPMVSAWKSGYRNFESVEGMNSVLTKTINKYVKEGDILYFLGDFCFGGHTTTPTYRHSLICKNIHVCRGNHDPHIHKYADLFSSIQDTLQIKDNNGHVIFLSHYAHRVWEGSHKGYIHLYGHSHGSIPDYGKSMDVGVDVAYKLFDEYRPFSLEEILQIMNKKEVEFPDHHGINTNIR